MAEIPPSTSIQPGLVISDKRSGRSSGRRGFTGARRPLTHIEKLVSRMGDYLYLPTAKPVYVMLGAVIGNMMKGANVWVVFVGPASSGKTVKLESLEGLKPPQDKSGKWLAPGVHIVGGIQGPASLLSGVSKKDAVRGATGGLLIEIGTRGVMVMKDFSSMLSLNHDNLNAAIDGFRQTFDGRYERVLGTDGGMRITWKGKMGLIAASTPAIDQYQKSISELGERWMYYRYAASDGYGETIKALGQTDPDAMMGEMRALVANYFEQIGVQWDEERRELTGSESNRLYAISAFVTSARSTVPRDPYQRHEISDMASKEGPARLATQLGQLYIGLERGGVEESYRWELVCRVAWDSIKQSRAEMIRAVEDFGVARVSDVQTRVPMGKNTVERLLEDLTVHGVLEWCERQHNVSGEVVKGGWRLSHWAGEHLKLGWGETRAL